MPPPLLASQSSASGARGLIARGSHALLAILMLAGVVRFTLFGDQVVCSALVFRGVRTNAKRLMTQNAKQQAPMDYS